MCAKERCSCKGYAEELLHNVYTRSLIPCIQHGTIIMMMIIITITIIVIIIIIIIIIIFNKGAQLTTAVLSGALIN